MRSTVAGSVRVHDGREYELHLEILAVPADFGPWSYSPVRVRIVHNPDGSINHYVDSGEDGSTLVDEFIYVGSGNACWPMGDASGPHRYQVTAHGRKALTALLAARFATVAQLTKAA